MVSLSQARSALSSGTLSLWRARRRYAFLHDRTQLADKCGAAEFVEDLEKRLPECFLRQLAGSATSGARRGLRSRWLLLLAIRAGWR